MGGLSLSEMIELGDPDELVREIDRLCDRRAWNELMVLRDRCHMAVERGKQLWGAAAHAEYRLALQAPGDLAAVVIESKPGRFTLGPLAEVAASTHRWHELGRSLTEGPMRALTAYECVVRGEDLSGIEEASAYQFAFELPLALQPWEPEYSTAQYKEVEAGFPMPKLSVGSEMNTELRPGIPLLEPEVVEALKILTQAWTDESNGQSKVAAVQGGAAQAAFALGLSGERLVELNSFSAIAWMAWAGASGGAHGRRAGAAAGRSKTWWALAALTGTVDDWPLSGAELGDYLTELTFWTWGNLDVSAGWALRLIVVDHNEEVAFAINADDHT